MADPNSTSPDAPGAAALGKPHGSILGKLVIALFLAAVILTECLVAYLYLPSGAAPEAKADVEAVHKEAPKEEKKKEAEKPAGESKESSVLEQAEVDMEEFSVTAFQPSTNTTVRIDFHLYGTVDAKEQEEFSALLGKNVHRFREQVIFIVRSAELQDLTDAGLGLIKRRILEKTNHTLGKPLLKAVIVSDFSFLEQ
jgi:flagellar basal body-associated protein FliL